MGPPPKKNKDATRAERKAKKRKLEDAIPDLPGGGMEITSDTISTEKPPEKASKKRKRTGDDVGVDAEAGGAEDSETKAGKKEKRAKRKKDGDVKGGGEVKKEGDVPVVVVDAACVVPAREGEEEEAPRKSKKERKADRKAREAAEASKNAVTESADTNEKTDGDGDAEVAGKKKSRKNNRNREKKRNDRFIVFIGNLPFSATTESVKAHFASVKPISVRHLTKKEDPTKSKGCAFVEFEGYDHMKTCLKLFHHSMFDDGISPGRKINVELTAGGGGNTKDRKAKIEGKNLKLNEERIRRIHEEEKTKWEKKDGAADETGIHPSRRSRVDGA